MAISIGPDKYLIVNGKKRFACVGWGIFSSGIVSSTTQPRTDEFLQNFLDFTYSLEIGLDADYPRVVIEPAERIGLHFTKEGWNMPAWAVMSHPLFAGYLAKDEPLDADFETLAAYYQKMKVVDPTKFMHTNVWHNGLKSCDFTITQ